MMSLVTMTFAMPQLLCYHMLFLFRSPGGLLGIPYSNHAIRFFDPISLINRTNSS